MPEVEIKVNNIDVVEEELQKRILQALEACGQQAERYAKALCPEDTGRLISSITHVLGNDGESEYIGTNVEYAPYVELGHITASGSKVQPQPYLKPALSDHVNVYKGIIEAYLNKSIN